MLDSIYEPQIETPAINSNQIELSMNEWYNLCFTRPDVFAHNYFGHILRSPSSDFHFLLYDIIKRINGTIDSNYVAIAAPRGNAKTQIMSVILPIWCVAFETKKFIVLISETGRLAEGNLEAIKHELTQNEKLKEDFPYIIGANPKMWRKEAIDTANDIRIIALGSGKQTRGHVKRGGIRPDLILNDDLDSDELVRTKSRRDQHEDWFLKSVLGMAGAGQKMDAVVAGTIIHPHSLLAKMLSPDHFAGWEKYKYKAVIQPSKSPLWYTWEKIYINAANNNRRIEARKFFEENEEEMMDGVEVLWPEGDGYYHLMEFRINKGVRAFFSEKQNDPVDPSTTLFDYTKIQMFNLDEINLKELDIYGAIDPASGDAKLKGDLAAIVTIGKDRKTGIKYVLDVKADESTPSACIEYIKIMHEEYNYKKFGVDSDSLKLFKDFIQKEIPDLSLTLYDLRLQKRKRIDRLEPPMHNGNIRIQENQTELIEELTFYPKSEHDDVLDALEIAVRLTGHKGYRLLTYR